MTVLSDSGCVPSPPKDFGLDEKLEQLRSLRLQFFEQNPTSGEKERVAAIRVLIEHLYQKLMENGVENCPSFHLACGQILNELDDWDIRAEHHLSIAARQMPRNPKASLQYAICAAKRTETVPLAIQFIQLSLEQERSPDALSILSVALRSTLHSLSAAEAKTVREKALAAAREAVSICDSHSDAWLALANGLLSDFFFDSQRSPKTLEEAVQSYEKALSLGEERADAYVNLGTALRFSCDMTGALAALEKAVALERRPETVAALSDLSRLLRNVYRSAAMGAKRGGRVGVPSAPLVTPSRAFSEPHVALSRLRPGANEGVAVHGSVVEVIPSPSASFTPFLLLLTELPSLPSSSLFVLALHNISSSWGVVVGDWLTVRNPHLVFLPPSGHIPGSPPLSLLRVFSPLSLLRNGKRLGRSHLALAQVSIENEAAS